MGHPRREACRYPSRPSRSNASAGRRGPRPPGRKTVSSPPSSHATEGRAAATRSASRAHGRLLRQSGVRQSAARRALPLEPETRRREAPTARAGRERLHIAPTSRQPRPAATGRSACEAAPRPRRRRSRTGSVRRRIARSCAKAAARASAPTSSSSVSSMRRMLWFVTTIRSCMPSPTKRSRRTDISSGPRPSTSGLRMKNAAEKYSMRSDESSSGRSPLIVSLKCERKRVSSAKSPSTSRSMSPTRLQMQKVEPSRMRNSALT